MRRFLCPLFLLCFFLHYGYGQVITIGDTGDFPTLSAAQNSITPGDTLLLQAQVFSDGTQFLTNINGTATAPIVILAEAQHQSIFRGGTEAIHLINCSYIEINGVIVEQQTGNGINIDDGGDYSTPAKHITIRNCILRDMAANGNNDLLKMSGVDSFLIEQCQFFNGGEGGSGIDFVGCHWGTVQDCYFDAPGTSGIQNKGGTQFIRIQRNVIKDAHQRGLNLGGSTGLQFFRPPLSDPIVNAFEAADLEVFANVFIGNRAPIAYVGCVRVKVYNNTFYHPDNWVIRILQETTEPGFLTCADNEFRNNIIQLPNDLTEVNIGPNTAPTTFMFSNNLWYNEGNNNWTPTLPVMDVNQIIADPLLEDPLNEDFSIPPSSPAVGNGEILPEPSTDFMILPYHTPPSIGAYEGSDAPLPIGLISFYAHPTPAGILLSWQTAFERNNRGFTLQRSMDALDWKNLSFIPGRSALRTQQSYHWLDRSPIVGLVYYRLRQEDFDGSLSYSPLAVFRNGSEAEISVFPNPARGQINYQCPSSQGIKIVYLLNASGQVLQTSKSLNGIFNLTNLPLGTYHLVFQHSGGTIAVPFIRN